MYGLRLALRSLARDRGTALLGGLSLSVALASCILIALFVRDELSYDRGLPHADRVSVLAIESEFGGERSAYTSTPYVLSGTLRREVPAVESATTTLKAWGATVVREGQHAGADVEALFADSSFFDVVQLTAVAGDPARAIRSPGSAALTASAARRLFGTTQAVGRDLTVSTRGGDTLVATVGAVVADVPQPSSLEIELVLPIAEYLSRNPDVGLGWGGNMWETTALRRAGATPASFQRALDAVSEANRNDGETMRVLDVPITGYRFSEFAYADGFGASALYVRLFAAVAGLILLLGAINTVNLATARGARRAKEIGVRKALGSGRSALVRQFLTESVVLSVASAAVGLALAAVALPVFNETFGKELALSSLDPAFLAALGASALVVGVVAGLYPAVYLSGFEPVGVLRGGGARVAGEAFLARTWLRRGLVVFQFAAVIGLLVGTGAVARQVDFVRSAPLGLEPAGLVVVPITDVALFAQSASVKAEFAAVPGVVSVARATGVPPQLSFQMANAPDAARPDLNLSFSIIDGDADYAETLGLHLVAGRWYADGGADAARAVVVNETFARRLGWTPADAIGHEVQVGGPGASEIVGVTQDFHVSSLREAVGPVIIGPAKPDAFSAGDVSNDAGYGEIAVRFAPGRQAAGLAALEASWRRMAGDAPFEARVVQEQFDHLSEDEERLARTFGLFAGVAVLIAALGLVGLASYTAERRTKEVGVRRVLGASVASVVGLLSREYVALVAIAALVASPVAVVLVRRWLDGFAYHAPFSPLVLVGASFAALALALVSVGGQALRAARRDPVRSLRSE